MSLCRIFLLAIFAGLLCTPVSAVQSQNHHGQKLAGRSAMADGRWVKISIPQTGYYELTDSFLMSAGFDNPERVSLRGFGGALQPEALTEDYLLSTDDLPQVPLCQVGGRRLFYGVGPVNWSSSKTERRQRNHYSSRGFYFLTDSGDGPLLADSAAFADMTYPVPNDFHTLYEVDDFAWYHGGQNLYDKTLFGAGIGHSYKLPAQSHGPATLTIAMTYNNYCVATVKVNGQDAGSIIVNEQTTRGAGAKDFMADHRMAAADVWTFGIDQLDTDTAEVTITQLSGGDMHLDYIDLCSSLPRPQPSLTTVAFPQPRMEGSVENQNLHADEPVNMVIIVPSSGLLVEQAERLAQLHRDDDGMTVRVVRADQLYNEFSSGTPDVNAYRRYLKMLYDRDGDRLQYLLLFGDGAWDNRMLLNDWSQTSTADFLLCYESDNAISETESFVSDDYFGLMDSSEGPGLAKADIIDLAIGRIPARTPQEAAAVVDKCYDYRRNIHAGSWQNTICFMGDDGNSNMHMKDADAVALLMEEIDSAFDQRKVYWDAYQRTASAHGYAYPEVTRQVRQQMREGALLMNYSGHGARNTLSHEYAVTLSDFRDSTSMRLPLWFTASCDISAFDGQEANIGEAALFNPNGGAIAFVGTTRTVYAQFNRNINKSFTQMLFATDGQGKPLTFGEALRRAKNEQVGNVLIQSKASINRLHFVLLGDPALRLNRPTGDVVIDSINGLAVDDTIVELVAGGTATVVGHIADDGFTEGVATLTMKDAEVTTVCRLNPQAANEMPSSAMTFKDRPSTLFVGSDSVKGGVFRITFAVPKDVSYSNNTGQMLVYAIDTLRATMAHGACEQFVLVSAENYDQEENGPDVELTLEPDLTLIARVFDKDGINVSGSGIGHDMELAIDGQASLTYNMNDYFAYDFGDYRRGTVRFRLPQLADGSHRLQFRVWDVLNNSTIVTMEFRVQGGTVITGIVDIDHRLAGNGVDASRYYDVQGCRLTKPCGHIVVQQLPDGRVRKIVADKGNK